jgi:hypothetical protein
MSIQHIVLNNLSKAKHKVYVCVPTRDMMHAHFAYCLQDLVAHNKTIGLETHVEFNLGTLIGTQREKLAGIAIQNEATHILWLDSDMMFPKDVCEKLLRHAVPFVACNYSTRSMPFKSVSYQELYNWDSHLPTDATGLVVVEGTGLGCALVETSLFDDIHKPWFPITYIRKSDDYLGEDMNFCMKINSEASQLLLVDADLSRNVYHIGSTAFSNNHQPVTTG